MIFYQSTGNQTIPQFPIFPILPTVPQCFIPHHPLALKDKSRALHRAAFSGLLFELFAREPFVVIEK